MTLASPRLPQTSGDPMLAAAEVRPEPTLAFGAAVASPFPVPWIFSVALACFCLGVTAGDRFPAFLTVGWLAGGVLAFVWFLSWLRRPPVLFSELGLYWVFVVWAALSGMLVAQEYYDLGRGLYRAVLIGGLFTLLGCYCASSRNPASVFMAAILVASTLAGYSLATGDFAVAAEIQEQSQKITATRAASLTSNANGLGLQSLCGIMGLAFFWRMTRSWAVKVLIPAAALLFLTGILYSASRKTSVALLVFLVSWGWLCYRRYLIRNWMLLALGAVVLVAGYVAAQRNWDKTFLGKRWSEVGKEMDRQDSSVQTRFDLYREGGEMLLSHPLTGVGLSQFELHSSSGLYAHSEFMEILATTGPVGFMLYFSMFAILVLRLRRILRRAEDDRIRYAAGFSLAVLIGFGAHAIGAPLFNSLAVWCLLPGMFGFAFAAGRACRPARAALLEM